MEITIRIEIILLILAIIIAIYVFTYYSCIRCKTNHFPSKEGFNDLGDYSIIDKPLNTKSWFQPSLTYTGKETDKAVKAMLNRPAQPVPLPEGEMLMFANTEFKPEYCPNTYSNSTGCAGMTVDQYNYLINRGGNNVPYSEY
jgi:hypothetical protein